MVLHPTVAEPLGLFTNCLQEATNHINTKRTIGYYADKAKTRVIKLTYNAAMSKRLIRKTLIEEVGLNRGQRWGFFQITDEQFDAIIEKGGVNEALIID